ncbi:Phospholipid-transporting ATPase DNF1 [Fusarium oxysporum f. sp. albedinis]|nr:Phospholipid-transporting ATPase DNF1 [Fusarium oxysporum f. sp. albedinis]
MKKCPQERSFQCDFHSCTRRQRLKPKSIRGSWTNGPSPPATEKIPKSEDSWLVCKLPGEEPQLRSTLVQETSIPTRLEQSQQEDRTFCQPDATPRAAQPRHITDRTDCSGPESRGCIEV